MKYLVLEGDWGGQVYLTVPADGIGPEAKIDVLLSELDRVAWACNAGDGARAYFCERIPGENAGGGMGGGELTDGLWIHENFRDEWIDRATHLLNFRVLRPPRMFGA